MEVSEPMRRVTITISDAAYEKAEREAFETGETVAQFCAWLVESYEPPMDAKDDDE